MKLFILYGGCLFLTFFTLLGDCLIKEATLTEGRKTLMLLLLTTFIWGMQPYGWYYIIRHYGLFDSGVVFAAIALLGGCAISYFWYKEAVNIWGWAGMILTLLGMICLAFNEGKADV